MADFDTYPWQTFFNYLPVRTQQAYGPATPPGYQKPVQPTYDPFQYTQNRQSIGQMLRGGAQTVGQGIRGFGNYLANTPLPASIGSPRPYNAAQGQQPNMGNMIRQSLGAQNLPRVRPQITQAAPAAMSSTASVMAQPQAGTYIAPGQNPALDAEIAQIMSGIDARGQALRAAYEQSPAGNLAQGRIAALQQQRAAIAPRATTEADWNDMEMLAGRGDPAVGRSVLGRMRFDANRRDNRPAVGTQFLQTPIPETRQQRWERELATLPERAAAAKSRIENMSEGERARLALQNTPPWWLPGGEAYDKRFTSRRDRAEKKIADQRDAFQARRAGMTITDYRRSQEFADMRNQLMSQLTQQTGGAAGGMDPLAVGMALGPQAAQIAQASATLRAQTSAADADRRSREAIATADRGVQQAMVDVQRARSNAEREEASARLQLARNEAESARTMAQRQADLAEKELGMKYNPEQMNRELMLKALATGGLPEEVAVPLAASVMASLGNQPGQPNVPNKDDLAATMAAKKITPQMTPSQIADLLPPTVLNNPEQAEAIRTQLAEQGITDAEIRAGLGTFHSMNQGYLEKNRRRDVAGPFNWLTRQIFGQESEAEFLRRYNRMNKLRALLGEPQYRPQDWDQSQRSWF